MAQAAPRIKGQETSIDVIVDNVVQQNFIDIRSLETEEQLEIIREGYLGETTDRRDSVYRGFSGRLEAHMENRSYLDFRQTMVDKARRRNGVSPRVNIRTTLAFPGGPRVRVVLKDVSFGPMPMNIGNRSEYVTVSLSFEGESTQLI